jgi:hypothetical protein
MELAQQVWRKAWAADYDGDVAEDFATLVQQAVEATREHETKWHGQFGGDHDSRCDSDIASRIARKRGQ